MKSISEIVADHPFFCGMRPEHIAILIEGAAEVSLPAEQIIFRERDPANQFYLIQEGRVAVEAYQGKKSTALVQELHPGDVLGWSWLFPPFSWHFQARALTPVRAIALNGARLLVTAERDRDFGYELMKRVARVLIFRLQSARQQILDQQLASALDG